VLRWVSPRDGLRVFTSTEESSMARSEPTHVALITGGGKGIGTANPDPEVLYAIADTAFAGMRHH